MASPQKTVYKESFWLFQDFTQVVGSKNCPFGHLVSLCIPILLGKGLVVEIFKLCKVTNKACLVNRLG